MKSWQKHPQLKHLFISPLEECNLKCEICYTKKSKKRLSKKKILDFIIKYIKEIPLESVTFCGGEVFLLEYFVDLVNELTKKGIIIQIITNGTINVLKKFKNPELINIIVSIDGPKDHHDLNRGIGNYEKSISFLKKATLLGFHTHIFQVVTPQNYTNTLDFKKKIGGKVGNNIKITLHPRKPNCYLSKHPIDNCGKKCSNFSFLDSSQLINLFSNSNTFPPNNLGCFQISLKSNEKIYACCEGINPIGELTDDIENIINKLLKRLIYCTICNNDACKGCVEPNFLCGFTQLCQKQSNS